MSRAAIQGRRNARAGADAEAVISGRMRALGIQQVERVSTPWRIHRQGGRIVGASPVGTVSADWRGVLPVSIAGLCRPVGISVLLECKRRDQVQPDGKHRSLRLSDFETHQPGCLTAHDIAGGLSLIGWVGCLGVAIVPWAECGIFSGHGMQWGHAVAHQISTPRQAIDYAASRP